jgi:G3E family GTPase
MDQPHPTNTTAENTQTPLILLTGFLGAGKTTLLRTITPLIIERGLVPQILINDYRNARVDAELLRGLTERVTPISGTCICCDSRYHLMDELSTASLTPDSLMLIEANGTADAPELIEILTADPKAKAYTPPVQVVVIDAMRWQKRNFHNALEKSQVPTAGYVVFTRMNEVSIMRQKAVMEEVAALAPRAAVVEPAELVDALVHLHAATSALQPRRFHAVEHHHGHHHKHHTRHHFSSLELRLPGRVRMGALKEYLLGLPLEVIRVKGIAYDADRDGQPVYFQKIEGRDGISIHLISGQITYDPVAIFIGVGLNAAAFEPDLIALAEESLAASIPRSPSTNNP